MARPVGAKNIVPFEFRTAVPVTAAQDVKHLANHVEANPLEQFKALVRNQRNFLDWIDSRHNALVSLKKQATGRANGPKDSTYRKYRWYARQLALLEVINGFELFYKKSMINLGIALHGSRNQNQRDPGAR